MKVAVVAVMLLGSPAFAEKQIVDNNASVTVDCKKDSEVSLVATTSPSRWSAPARASPSPATASE